ncbi:dUTP diphosphatase [Lentilactobacillus senioris]|uniref:dUTP diphosphatase n=1 Tax=Lentilactobacillus senioris TaxID=931534 RepID=UPI002282DD5F|nr:dUTP diphosphatase [Lentilactobacillus senioris]MCY9806917.1 dUTP diphosphatase [Lentilactobacillus senioris]
MDLKQMLMASVNLNRSIEQQKGLSWNPERRLANAYVALDVELAEVANTSEWFKVWKTHRGKHDEGKTPEETLLVEYCDAFDFFLLLASLKKWTAVILDSQEQIADIIAKKPEQFLDKQYLILKQMLFKSYFNHDQSSFAHAWHLFLKLGLVDFQFSPEQIQTAFQQKNQLNFERQQNNY